MTCFSKYLKADFYKFSHSKIIFSHFIIPILGLIIMLSYYVISSWSELDKISVYLQVVAMAFPLIISIIVTMVYEQEEEGSRFQYFLSVPDKKYVPHLSKLFLLIILGIISTIISILGFGLIFKFIGNDSVSLLFYLKEVGIMFISNIPIYMIQYLVVFCFGKGASIGLGIVGSLIAALMITGIGDGIWFVLPWGYSIRFSSYFFQYNMKNSLVIIAEEQVKLAMVSILIFIIVFVILQLVFSNYWEGRREND